MVIDNKLFNDIEILYLQFCYSHVNHFGFGMYLVKLKTI